MLRLNLEQILGLRGIKHPHTYLIMHGLTDSQARTLLSEQMSQIKMKRLTQLCEIFSCTPNDLMTWNGPPEHHLASLICPETKSITQLLEGRSPNELRAISRMLEEGEGF